MRRFKSCREHSSLGSMIKALTSESAKHRDLDSVPLSPGLCRFASLIASDFSCLSPPRAAGSVMSPANQWLEAEVPLDRARPTSRSARPPGIDVTPLPDALRRFTTAR